MSTLTTQARTGIPRVPADVIPRPRITALLDSDAPLTVVRGACGAGKTVAIAEWARNAEEAVLWVGVDRQAGTSVALARSVLHGLVRQGLARFGGDAVTAPWSAIRTALHNLDEPFVLVVDDAGFLTREAIDDVCRIVAETQSVRLIAATNRRSFLDSHALSLMIDRTVITPHALMFDAEEISRVLEVDERTAERVLHATAGFPAAVHATAIHALSRRRAIEDPDELLQLTADTVEEYLRARVERSGYDPGMISALVRMSIARTLDAPLARALTGDENAVEYLSEAESVGFGGWTAEDHRVFAFAPLARVLLRREAERALAAELPQLRRIAVDGALRRRAPEEALRLAVEHDDLALAAHTIMSGWNTLLDEHGKAVVELLGALPVSRLREEPLVAMLLAICYLASKLRRLRGLQLLRIAIAAANSQRRALPAIERIFIWTAESAALRLIGMPDRAGVVATKALRLFMHTPEPEWEAYANEMPLVCTQLGISLYYAGLVRQAVDCLTYAASLAAAHRARNAFHSIALLGGIHALRGDMPEARHYVELVRDGGWSAELLDGYRGVFYRIAEALIAVEEGRPADAEEHLEAFAHQRTTSEHWTVMAATEAWVSLHLGQPSAGLERLESLARHRGREATSAPARHALSRARALLHLALSDIARAKEVIHRDSPADRFATALEQARIALVEGRAADAARILDTAAMEPESVRQRAEAAALRCAALYQTAGEAGARTAAAALASQLSDRELSTPLTVLSPEHRDPVHALLVERGFTAPRSGSVLASLSQRPRLTAREHVVLHSLVSGAAMQAIATELGISQNTLKTQLRGLYRKLGAKNRIEALENAARFELLGDAQAS